MSPSAPSQNGSDVILAEVVEEFTNRVQAGESVDVESYAQQHPEYAERLRQLLPALTFLAEVGRSADTGSDGVLREAAEDPISGTLGDFRLLREVGRGGMGVVYEAEQISLRRRVALKVLPFVATMDPRHLQRFHNEARAAACLHHTNIVPVFSVGCERGVHFYAMQFIDGQPLSALIRQSRPAESKEPSAGGQPTVAYQPSPDERVATSPTVRTASDATLLASEGKRSREYFRKVAEALDYAHQLGIVHRDIKPGNLLLDGRGILWVTDFGLAHMRQGEANLTVTGQLMGTPRYMSPEQALAQRVPIDHRTDVYPLGATLYELLTLRPAFDGDDRQELLQQIASEEPARPRRLERAIPGELEIIVLKAMEKRPQDRYSTAQELADDLRRWLLDQPIRARRPSWSQVVRRWARRHKSVVWSAALGLLLLLVFGFSNAFWWMGKQTAAEMEARAALQEAERWQQEEKWSEALSAVRRAQGVLGGFGAEAALKQQIAQRGRDVEMAQRLEETRLQYTTVKDGHFDWDACIASYAAAFQWYGLDVENLEPAEAGERIRAQSIHRQLVTALDHWAFLLTNRNDRDRVKQLLAVARAADPDPWRDRLRDYLEGKDPKALSELVASAQPDELPPATAVVLAKLTRETPEAERVAILLRQLWRRHPNDFWVNHELAYCLQFLRTPRLEEAIPFYTAAIALRPQSPGVHINLGYALHDKGHLDEAIAEYREAIQIQKDYVMAHLNLGYALRDKGRLDEAIVE
ncbi:MAG TPA: protein kinase [Gemmataceae bacterium]|jgi:serine/threonine protein kinase